MSKLTIYAMVFCYSLTMAFGSKSEAQTKLLNEISVELGHTDDKLIDVIREVEANTDFTFMYVKRTMADKKVSISAGIWDLYDLMYEISSQAKVSVRRVNDIISLKTLETSNGTVTDIDGNFKLEVNSEDAILVVSFVGYQSLEISVNGRSSIEVLMTPDLESLDEVVIVAYGEQSKQKVTGSIQKVDAEELQEIPVAQVTQKLQGKLAGVQILQNTGTPGSGMSVRVRGQASISAGSDPLYVVDGFPITGNISNMNPDEIESITILKDASATSLYGSRAANGVVLVTTKRAKGRENQISFSSYYGIQQIPESGKPDMMNATEFAQFKKEIFEENNRDVPEAYQNPEQYGEGTNWFDLLTRNAPIQNYSLSIKGSRDKFNTSIVGGYFKQEGVLLNSEFERISLRANMDYEVNDNIRVGLNLAPTFTNSKSPQTDGVWYETGGILQGALLTNPIYDYKNEDGTIPYGLPNWDNEFFVNGVVPMPNWWHQVQAVKNTSKNMGVLSNIFLEADLLPGLTYKLMAGVDVGNSVSDYFSPSTAGGVFNPGNPDDPNRISGSHSNSFGYSWMLENTLKYGRSIGKHDFDVLAGYTAQAARGESGVLSGSGFPDNRIQTLNAATTITGSTDIQEWSLASVVGRINYSFDNKYVLSAAIRADGSSKFGAQNRWGSFPSISAGWVVSEESFMQSIPLVSFLKLRGSVGVTGNNNVGNYTQYASVVSTNNPFNNVLYGGKSLAGLNNEELGWERTTQTDIGLEVGVLNDRIALSYDYYNKLTTDLLYTVEIPISSGFYNFATNIGDFQFWGHEFALNTKNFVGPFTWNTNFNISFNRNEALKLGTDDAPVRGEFTITEVGKPLGQLYGLQTDGVFEDQAAYDAGPTHSNSGVGTIRFVDQDDDGVVNNDERDYTYLGNTSPKFIYGFTNSFAYKNFDLTIVAQGGYGNKIVNVVERFTGNLDGAFNVNRGVLNRWKSESDPGDGRYGTTRAGTTGPERDWFNDKWIYDASYLTIKNITLGYNLPTQNMKAIQALRVYASIQQALVFTQYPGANPEVSAAGGLFSGADRTTYPVPRTYSLGFNLTL